MKRYSRADIIAMGSGKKELPVGLYKSKNGYRIYFTIEGILYSFSSYQNIEHALRVHTQVKRLIDKHRELLEEKATEKEKVVEVLKDVIDDELQKFERNIEQSTLKTCEKLHFGTQGLLEELAYGINDLSKNLKYLQQENISLKEEVEALKVGLNEKSSRRKSFWKR